MDTKDFKVGDKVCLLDYGWRSNFDNAVLKEVTVTAVGRKYVTVNGCYKFYKNRDYDMFLSASSNSHDKLFVNVQGYEDYKEHRELVTWFNKEVEPRTLSLEQLRQIKSIIEEEQKEKPRSKPEEHDR